MQAQGSKILLGVQETLAVKMLRTMGVHADNGLAAIFRRFLPKDPAGIAKTLLPASALLINTVQVILQGHIQLFCLCTNTVYQFLTNSIILGIIRKAQLRMGQIGKQP